MCRNSLWKSVGILILTAVLSLGVTGAARAQRMALVVGNSDYTSVYPLANPVNDATAVADKLKGLGFDVTLLTDARSSVFWPKLTAFTDAAKKADTVLFYFAGHAFQLDGVNYLVPVDAKLASIDSIRTQTWDLDAIISRLNAPDRQTLIFLDACRNNPLPKSVQAETQGRRGLARLQTGSGTFVAFATAPNSVTYDGDETKGHSPFSQAILDNIDTPGISISDMMIQVRNEVQQKTFDRQTPWDQSSLNAQFYFNEQTQKKDTGFGAAELEFLAKLPADQRTAFLALLKKNDIKTQFSDKAIADTIVIKKAEETKSGGSITIAGAAPQAQAGQMVPQHAQQVAAGSVAGKVAGQVAGSTPAETAGGAATGNIQTASVDQSIIQAPIAELPRAQQSSVVGQTQSVEVKPGIIVPAKEIMRGGVFRSVTLTSLAGQSLPPDALVRASARLIGSEIDPNSPEGQAILQEVYGNGLKVVDGTVQVTDPMELNKEVQSQLARLGCYRMTIDGDWGRGSKTAAARYYAAKLIVPDNLDATPDLLRQLKSEQNVVCQNTVAKDQRVAQIVQQDQAPAPRSFRAQTPAQKQETKAKIGLRPGVFR